MEQAEDEIEDIQQEINIMSQLQSSFVTKYYGSYIQKSKLWIIMEYCEGGSCLDLVFKINKLRAGVFEEIHIAIIIREVLQGLEHLHSQGKLHRDIKAANLLVAGDGSLKIADFGVSGQLTATFTRRHSFVGTPFWMAPEVIEQTGYDCKADIWSMGITAIELAKGQAPYSDMHPMRALFLIPKNEPPLLEGNFSKLFKGFVAACLEKDASKRPTAKELLKHPFIKQAKENRLLKELIAKHNTWLADQSQQTESFFTEEDTEDLPDSEPWDFGTVKQKVPMLPKKITIKVPPPPPKVSNFVDSHVLPKLKSIPTQTPELIQLGKSFQELESKSPGMALTVLKLLKLE